MQFWIGILVGAMIGASIGVAVLAWMFASRRADDAAARQRARAEPVRDEGRRGAQSARVLELPRSVLLTSSDAQDLRAAADHLESHGGNDGVAHRLRDIASRAEPDEARQSIRKGS